MFDSAHKLMLAGLGALTMTRERAEQIFDDAVRRGQAAQDDRSGFVKDLMDGAEKMRGDLEELVNRQVKQTLMSMDVATREDLQRIEAKLDEVLARETSAD